MAISVIIRRTVKNETMANRLAPLIVNQRPTLTPVSVILATVIVYPISRRFC